MDQVYVDELKQLLEIAKHPEIIALLQKAISDAETDSCQPQENGPSKLSMDAGKMDNEMSMKPISRSKQTSISMSRISNYGWDQSDKFVKIYINGMDGIKIENIRSDFNQRYVKVELVDVCGKNYALHILDLYSEITPDKCTSKVKGDMVVVSLRKSNSKHWEFLTVREKRLKDSKELKPPKMQGADEDPGQGLMQLMKKMYDDGDDEMKRTIAKSWQEAQDKKSEEGRGL